MPSSLARAACLLGLLATCLPSARAAETDASPAAPAGAATPRLATLGIEAALALARAHLAARPAETNREIVGAHFIPPHGREGAGFWLIDLAPYPTDRPAPVDPFTSLLVAMDGSVEQRGGRRPLNPDEQKARDEKAASLRRLTDAATAR
jgi:hypothetical protein